MLIHLGNGPCHPSTGPGLGMTGGKGEKHVLCSQRLEREQGGDNQVELCFLDG